MPEEKPPRLTIDLIRAYLQREEGKAIPKRVRPTLRPSLCMYGNSCDTQMRALWGAPAQIGVAECSRRPNVGFGLEGIVRNRVDLAATVEHCVR